MAAPGWRFRLRLDRYAWLTRNGYPTGHAGLAGLWEIGEALALYEDFRASYEEPAPWLEPVRVDAAGSPT